MDQYDERKKEYPSLPEEEDENIYSSRARERLVDEDNLQTHEDAFMQGYEEGMQAVEEEEEEFSWNDDASPEEMA